MAENARTGSQTLGDRGTTGACHAQRRSQLHMIMSDVTQ
jgi:hypothetical protein